MRLAAAAVAASVLALLTAAPAVVWAQQQQQQEEAPLTCPPSAPFDVSAFALPSGAGCLLCVPTMESCGVTCSCPTLDCEVYTCTLTPAGCGDVACAGDGTRVYPTPSPTRTPTASPTRRPTRPPTVPAPTVAVVPTVPEESRADCGGYETCRGCLSDSRCTSWYNNGGAGPGGGCFADNCPLPDGACYNTVFNPTQTPAMLCDAAARDEANKVRCAAQTTCADCAYMTLPDGSGRTCAWYDGGGVVRPWDDGGGGGGSGGGYCGPPGCDGTGCGDPDPANCPAVPCGSVGSCGDCLAAPGCDAWSAGTCFESCMGAPMDAACCECWY